MSAAARLVRSLAFSGAVALCSTPALAADGGIRLPDVDFTVSHVPYVPSVTVVLPPALVTNAVDVIDAEQARIAEDAGAVAVMALERVPADIRRDGGVARRRSRRRTGSTRRAFCPAV